ncbi:serine-rich adhesin for platelets-like isoform X19 [Montipora foliosa]|uniref:serine-rich adhesin for platelets-like isoform X19 n=1 Tax=Montipora foliosa TaxID=591990 RepID=UPI0035F16ABE
MSNVSRKDNSWSFDSEKWRNIGNNDPYSAVYAVRVKEEVQKGMYQHRGMACCVMVKVGRNQKVYFVTSSDLETDKKQADLLPCSAQKMEGCQLVVNSTVKFGPFSFLSFDRDSSPGLKRNPSLTRLDFQVPKQNLESEFEAYTMVGTKKLLKFKFKYQRVTGKYIFSASAKRKDHPEQSFKLGAPIIIKNKDVTDKHWNSRWPVVGVMGYDEKMELCPYFVTANIFDRRPVHNEGGCLVPGIDLNVTAADSRPAQSEGEHSVFGNELNATKQATSAGRSEERGAISQLASTSDSKEQATSAGRSEERGAISQLASTSDRKEQATSAGRSEERGAISQLASTSDSKEQATSAGRSEERGAISQLASTSDSKEQATSAGRSEERGAISQLASTSDSKEQATSAGRSEERGAISQLASTSDSKDGRFYYDLGMDYIISRFDFPKAIDCFEKSLDIAGKAGDQATEGKAALTLGISCQSQGNFPKAIESYEKSLNIARKTGDRAREGDDYSNLASVYESCGSLSKAIECYEKSLEISRKAGDRKREGKAYFSLGIVYDSLGDSRKASECYEKSVSITGDAGNAHDSHSDLPLAIELYKASSKVASEGGFQAGVNRANRDLANCSFACRDFSEAYTYGIEYLKTVNRVGAHTEETAERRPYNIHEQATSAGRSEERGAISQLASTSDSKEQATSAGRSEERGAISQLASTSDRKEQATSAGRSEERGAISRLASTSDSKDTSQGKADDTTFAAGSYQRFLYDMEAAKKQSKVEIKAYQQNMAQLKQNIHNAGLQMRDDIPDDGNCLFHAVADQMERLGESGYNHTDLRHLAVETLTEGNYGISKNDISKFVPNNDLSSYLTDMSRDGTWGDHIVLVALAHALSRKVVVVSSLVDSQNVVVEPDNHHGEPILLGHLSEIHYVSLEPMDV